MAGNVWEWTEDWYGDYGADAVDPAGAVSGTDRVIRGGSWNDDPRSVRVATRDSRGPSNQNIYVGFRLARSLAALPWSQGVPPIPSSSTSNCSAAPPGMVGGWPSSP